MKSASLTTNVLSLAIMLLLSLNARSDARSGNIAQQTSPALQAPAFRLVEGAPAPAGWKRYQFGDPVLFSVILPGEPMVFSKLIKGNNGELHTHLYLAPLDTAGYGVGYSDKPATDARALSDEADEQAIVDYLAGFTDGFIKLVKERGINEPLKLRALRKIKIGNVDGYEQEVSMGPYTTRTQALVKGQKFYSIFAIWNVDNPARERNQFFSSYRMVGGR